MFAHIDADSFFASVLQRKYPQYRNTPLIALGMGGSSVIAATYDVKSKGVRTGMRLYEAKKLCPNAIAIPSDFAETGIASKQIQSMVQNQSPLIEQASIDEWYVDIRACVGGTPKDLCRWAKELQTSVTRHTHIGVSIGIAPTKLLAKMSSEYQKPSGITIVHLTKNDVRIPNHEIYIEEFLKNRAVEAIPGIGSKRATHTTVFGWPTAYDFAHANTAQIQQIFGRPGLEMQQELLGIVVHPLVSEAQIPKSISRARSFKRSNSKEFALAHLFHHVSYTIIKLRRHNLMCKWVYVSIRDGDYRYTSKDYKLPLPMNTEGQILPYITRLFNSLFDVKKGCTQVSVALGQFTNKAAKQFTLFDDPLDSVKDDTIQETLDSVHNKFGRDAIMRASAIPIKSGIKRGLPTFE